MREKASHCRLRRDLPPAIMRNISDRITTNLLNGAMFNVTIVSVGQDSCFGHGRWEVPRPAQRATMSIPDCRENHEFSKFGLRIVMIPASLLKRGIFVGNSPFRCEPSRVNFGDLLPRSDRGEINTSLGSCSVPKFRD